MTFDSESALMDSHAIVRRFFHEFGADMSGAVNRHGADDLEWLLPSPPSLPIGGRWSSKQQVTKFLEIVSATFEPGTMRVTIERLIGSGSEMAAEIVVSARTRDGRDYRNEYAFFITLAGDKIVRVREYVDTARVLAFFPNPSRGAETK